MTLSSSEFNIAVDFAIEHERLIKSHAHSILKILNIDFFGYLHIHSVSSIAGLSSHVAGPDWVRNGLPLFIPPNNGFYLLPEFPDMVSRKLLDEWKENHNLDHLLYYFIHHKHSVELFAFAAEKSRKRVITSYLNNTNNMINYIAQFKKDNAELIKLTNKNYRWVYSNSLLLKPRDVEQKANAIISTRKEKLLKFEDDLCGLSEQEFQCLLAASNQYTAKETAILLNIDPRTVETYLNSCKVKLSCHSKRDMVHYFRIIMRH